MSKKPLNYRWSKFFWDDWGNDYKLQSCSAATQGIWINLLTLMFKSERPGYLQMNGRAMTILEIASFFKFDKRTIEKNLKILIEKGVCSVDENNVVFSRRMAREEQERLEQVQRTNAQDKCSKSSKDLQGPYRKVPVNLQDEIAENRQKSKVAYTEAEAEISSNADIKFKSGEIKNNDSHFKAKTQGSRLPENWAPTGQEREYAQNLGLDVQRVVTDFCDYWHSKAGKDATKLDWSRTWQRWCRQAKDWGKGNIRVFPSHPQRPQPRPSNLTWMVEEHEQRWGSMQ